jgi:hypothetical protein
VYISRDVVFDENVFPFASLHPNAGRRLSQDILLLPTENNACTHEDIQHDDHMSLPIIPVVTNTTQGTPLLAETTINSEDSGENLSENGEETSQNSHSPQSDDTNHLDSDPEEDPAQSDGFDPEEDPPSTDDAAPEGEQSDQSSPAVSPPLRVYTRRQWSPSWAPPPRTRSPPRASLPTGSTQASSPIGPSWVPAVTRPAGAAPSQPTGSSAPNTTTAAPVSGIQTRLQKGIRNPKVYKDGTVRYGMLVSAEEPRSLTEALADPNWCKAMEEEHDALLHNKTWHLVPPSYNKNVIDCKWVYRIKTC